MGVAAGLFLVLDFVIYLWYVYWLLLCYTRLTKCSHVASIIFY